MGYYLTISLATLLIVGLTIQIWRKTHCVGFLLGVVFMYYWSIYGGWAVIWSGGELDSYLYHKMFPVALDADYFLSLILYTAFIVAVQITVLCRVKHSGLKIAPEPIRISHLRVIAIAAVAGFLAYLLVKDTVSFGTELTGSGYATIRGADFFTIYETLLHFSMFPVAIGIAVLLSGKDGNYLIGKPSVLAYLGYAVVMGAQLVFCILVGNRSEAMICFVGSGLCYLANAKRPRKILLATFAIMGMVTLSLAKTLRDGTFEQVGNGGGLWEMAVSWMGSFFASAEVLAGHFSMYGVLHKHLPLTGGTSFISLVCSIVPRALWPDRPEPIYYYYIQGVGAIEGQGYTIHHGTGWYLNFGVAGLVLGAFLLGFLWAELYNRLENVRRYQGINRLYAIIGFWALTAGFPAVLREGPEVYKQVVIDYTISPLIVLGLAATTLVLREHRPSVAVARFPRRTTRASSASHS